ncbi:MAG: DNA-binding protein [Spirulina sp.]
MVRSTSYYEDLQQSLQESPDDAAMYLEVVLEEKDPKMLQKALNNVIAARGGRNRLSEADRLHYEKLTFALESAGCPELYHFVSLLESMGFELSIQVRSDEE